VTQRPLARVSREELAAEGATALPDKEVLSLLDLNADIDLALDAAAPIDLAIGANANIAAPIDAAASANVLSPDAVSAAQASQGALIHQGITGDASAQGIQDSTIDQGDASTPDAGTAGTTAAAPDAGTVTSGSGTTLPSTGDVTQGTLDTSGDLLNVNVNLDGDLDLAAPIDGAVAANANVAAPIDAAVSANIGSPGAESVAIADQTAIIDQSIDGDASAVADQVSGIDQGSTTTP
jgi:hypothetical protein